MLDDKNYIPVKGDLFTWGGDEYWCIESNIESGTVCPIDETFYIINFIWKYKNNKPKFIRKVTYQEYENMFGL